MRDLLVVVLEVGPERLRAGLAEVDRPGELLRDAARERWTLSLRPELRIGVRRGLEITGLLDVLPFEDEDEDEDREAG